MSRVFAATLVAVVAMLVLAGDLTAQRNVLTGEQVRESGARTAYDALTQLRPEWMSTARQGSFLVFVNGSRQGDLNALSEIPAELVTQMEYLEGAQLQARLTSASSSGVAAAIFVSTTRARAGRGGGDGGVSAKLPTLTVGVGSRLAAGDDWTSGPTSAGYEEQTTPGRPLDLLASFRFDMPALSLELFYGQEFEEVGETYFKEPIRHLRVSHRSRRMGLLIGREVGPVRVGVGPMAMITMHRNRSGECYCAGGSEYELMQRGGAAQVSYPLPLVKMTLAELRLMGHYVPTEETALWSNGPVVRIGGAQVTAGAALGVGPRR